MFHIPTQHSPSKHQQSRSAGVLRSTSPHKKQHQHAHRLGDGDIAPRAGSSRDSAVPIKPTQRTAAKPKLGKSIDASTAKALFGGLKKDDASSSGGSSSKQNRKEIKTPPSRMGGSVPNGAPLMSSPRRALGDKTNASPERRIAQLPQIPAWIQNDAQLNSLPGDASLVAPGTQGILQSLPLPDEEIDDMFDGDKNSGELARNPPEERPDIFADLVPAAESLSLANRNFGNIIRSFYQNGEKDEEIPWEPPSLAEVMGDAFLPPTGPKPTSKPTTKPSTTKSSTTKSSTTKPSTRPVRSTTATTKRPARP
ncbi:hypothetical protein OC845_001132 [Tilletia horrida]|nr:hypothetical protein OC845_001132 [Tilletia horrida]